MGLQGIVVDAVARGQDESLVSHGDRQLAREDKAKPLPGMEVERFWPCPRQEGNAVGLDLVCSDVRRQAHAYDRGLVIKSIPAGVGVGDAGQLTIGILEEVA
jgi:hypothetical protein